MLTHNHSFAENVSSKPRRLFARRIGQTSCKSVNIKHKAASLLKPTFSPLERIANVDVEQLGADKMRIYSQTTDGDIETNCSNELPFAYYVTKGSMRRILVQKGSAPVALEQNETYCKRKGR